MNVYRVTKCTSCGSLHFIEDEVILHSARNLTLFREEYNRLGWEEAAKKFCKYCGEKKPCSCTPHG